MDDSFNNVLEGTRQYFMGFPKQTQEGNSQKMWPGNNSTEEGTPALSGAPTPSSRPPSAAAAPPLTSASTSVATPPRPPSEPIEPEAHIIHKATVMREAAQKRREQPEIEDEEEIGELSPPSHIIRKPTPHTLPSPAPAPAVPSPSPVRPPSEAPLLPPMGQDQIDPSINYRNSVHRVQTPTARQSEHFTPGRTLDRYSVSRPPESFSRYQYETNMSENSRSSHGPAVASPQSSIIPRQSPQTYARMSSTIPQHTVNRYNDSSAPNNTAQRYSLPNSQAPPPHNDRVPPIHHPQHLPPTKRLTTIDNRTGQGYSPIPQRRDSPSFTRQTTQYERHPTLPQRKYDPQQAYSGYRPTPTVPVPIPNRRVETHHQIPYKHGVLDVMNQHYSAKSLDRVQAQSQLQTHEVSRLPARVDYLTKNSTVDSRNNYHYLSPSTSAVRYTTSATIPTSQNNSTSHSQTQSRTSYRTAAVPKTNYEYSNSNHVQISPSRSTTKPGYPSQQARMTVSVTSIVNQMNQTKQKRESPLDLSVKTVKNSADSSTTQDDSIDSVSMKNENIPLQTRPTSNSRNTLVAGYVASHKVDFSPDFAQYRERNISQGYNTLQNIHHPLRYNGAYTSPRPVAESYPVESRQMHAERSKYNGPVSGTDNVPRIDLTRQSGDDRFADSRIRDDRQLIIEDRKRSTGAIVSNIPEKIVRYETWASDSRIDTHIHPSIREQHELMSQPVYDYASYKRFEAYHNDQKHSATASGYREYHSHHRYSSNPQPEIVNRETSNHQVHYHDRIPSSNSRHIIQKIPSQRDMHSHHLDPHKNVQPADKKVLSILRNSLETKQTGFLESARPTRQIPDLIVIDDVDDSVIEITDISMDNEVDAKIISNNINTPNQNPFGFGHHIKMPKAVDSISRDSDYQKIDSPDSKTKSPEMDVASRIRTKAELKVMPPSQDNSTKTDSIFTENDKNKPLPKSQKQHLFNQIREDLRLESVIKNEKPIDIIIPDVKIEPLNIEEIEKDAVIQVKSETMLEQIHSLGENSNKEEFDLDWANACDNFMEQLKTGCHKKKPLRKRISTFDSENHNKSDETTKDDIKESQTEQSNPELPSIIEIKKEPVDEDELKSESDRCLSTPTVAQTETVVKVKQNEKPEKNNDIDKTNKNKTNSKHKQKSSSSKNESPPVDPVSVKTEASKNVVKEELESTDDDEPLIKSKLLKDKQRNLKYQLLKDLSEKSAYVKLECCDEQMNANIRRSLDSSSKDEKQNKGKTTRQISRSKGKSLSTENMKKEKANNDSSSDSDDELSVASRLRVRKNIKTEDSKSNSQKNIKSSPRKMENSGNGSPLLRKPGFGDGSDFRPGWEEELYRYKRSLRMPTSLIAIPRGRSGGPFVKGNGAQFTRGSTSLPDLDPVPLSPAPSSAPSAATDDFYRRPDKHNLDSDLESNSSCSAINKLHYDSEASTSTVFSAARVKKKSSSIVDVLIQKCGKREETRKKSKGKDDKTAKIIPKSSNIAELLPTPSLNLVKNRNKENLSAKKEKLMEEIFYLGAFRKETVTMFRTTFIKDTDGLIGATEEFAPVVLKSRTRTESRVLKQRATIKEVFGDDRPASAPPTSCRENQENEEELPTSIKKEPEGKPKFRTKKMVKEKLKRRSSSIRDGLRSTKSLKTNDAKGRLMRLKKRNSLLKSFSHKRRKDMSGNKIKKDINQALNDKDTSKDEGNSTGAPEGNTKRRLKRLFGRRKFSSGFDYIRKKKKIIRRENNAPKIRRTARKPSPESVHDIQKEIKSWFINKSIGETHLHRAARLGFTDCVAYCLEKMQADPSAKDNAGFTPLHVASAKGHVRIARLLLQYGANVSAAAQGGIRPLHEACENFHVEIIRLLLAYGADPLLGTYAGQTPEELAEGAAAKLLRLHIADVQGRAVEPWRFPPPGEIIDREENGCDPLSSPPPASPPPPPDSMMEIQCTEAPLPPFYSLRTPSGQPADGLWCLLQDITNILQIKSKESLLKQIHCGSGSPKELLREIRTQEFLERAQCHQLLCAGEKVNVRASKVSLVRVTDKLRQLLKIETVLIS
ncbi:unnamed protein product [Euphydryas editha]|uniref:BCL-6 corepressor n=1 Tax=Euphydryas editha TaxID=104508 RepID=A0AAU9V212_EUPED|nr:unnamed protein product [Euphydryas editha]